MDMNKIVTDLQQAFTEFKKTNDAKLAAIETKGFAPADLTEKLEKLQKAMDQKEEELKQIKTAMARTNQATETQQETKTEEQKKYHKIFNSYIKSGGGEFELKALSSDSDQDGGFLITPEMSNEIIKKVYETSPIRQYASVQTISTSSLQILQDLDETGAGWVGEVEARVETTSPQFKMIEIPVHEVYAQPHATQRFLDDAQINVESWLAEKIADKFARLENAAFVSGNGVQKAKGLVSYDAGTGFGQVEQINSGAASSITGDSLIELIYSLKTNYKPNAKFFMARGTVKEVRLLKDNDNRYLWAPGLDGNTAGSVLGYEIVEFNDLAAVAANSLSVVFGDLKQGYQIVDRFGIRTLRDPFTSKPYVKFYTTKRVGGGVKNFEAFKILKTAV
jgi:HK97 family phage major capsid protein